MTNKYDEWLDNLFLSMSKESRDGAIKIVREYLATLDAENEKLREALDQVYDDWDKSFEGTNGSVCQATFEMVEKALEKEHDKQA
jgi:hypothetical protein